MMYYILLSIFAYAALIIQSTLPEVLSLAKMTPDIILILVTFNGIFDGARNGAIVGFGLGLLEDIYIGRFIGMKALIKCIAGFVSGRLTQGAFRENMLVPLLVVLLNSSMSVVLFFVLSRILGEDWSLSFLYWKGLPEFIYTLCLVPVLYGPYFSFASGKDRNKEKDS